MNKRSLTLLCLIVFFTGPVFSQEDHKHHKMKGDIAGLVMNENTDTLPRDCDEISQEHEFTIHAGREYAGNEPGMIFGMSQHEVRVAPCSRVKITFVNDDSVRHQWMVHGLPKYLYPAGMFHIEVTGGQQKSGTLIVPGGDQTYLIHCDFAQHMEKGMRGQLVVGNGSGDLWGIRAISDGFYRSFYLPDNIRLLSALSLIAGFLTALIVIRRDRRQ